MSDLKIRLLEMSNCEANETAEIMVKAADRIEHLERVLAQAREGFQKIEHQTNGDFGLIVSAVERRCIIAIAAIDEALKHQTIGGTSDEIHDYPGVYNEDRTRNAD